MQFNEGEIDRQFNLISSIEREKSELKTVNAELLKESHALEELKEELLQEINEKECLITSYIPEYRSLRQSPSQKLKKKREKSPNGAEKNMRMPSFSRKQSLMEPVIVQIKEREEKEEKEEKEPSRPLRQSLLSNEDWRSDFSSKLKNSFGYYH